MKEKLLRLMYHATCESELEGKTGSCPYRKHGRCGEIERLDLCAITHLAEELLANGVTVQQWIPVEERRPDLIPCSAGTGYSEAVNVLTSGRKVLTAIWDGSGFIADADFWDAEGEEITHWTPVFLPLPQPPKEG